MPPVFVGANPVFALFILFTSLILSGCGFHLRGTSELSSAIEPTNIAIPAVILSPYTPYNPLYLKLHEALSEAGITVLTPKTNKTCPMLHYEDLGITQYTLVYGPQGQTRRERMNARLQFTLMAAAHAPTPGRVVFTNILSTSRDRQLNPNQDLADKFEKTILEKEIRQELITQMVRQLAFVSHQYNIPSLKCE